MPWFRALLVWLVIIVAELVHGTLRTLYLAPAIGDFPARRVGVFIGTALIFLIALAFTRWIGAQTRQQLLGIGLLWVVLTVMFEFGLGRGVFHYDWSRMLSDYDLSRGGLMGFGLLAMFFIPVLAARVRGLPAAGH
ncbi:MAG: hypothetical protein NTU56_15330 [Proteobacteria bacterium]|nr:hypothetical protein [Pseudomonadota bacterium]